MDAEVTQKRGNYVTVNPFQKEGAFLNGKKGVLLEGDFLEGTNLFTGYIHLEAGNLGGSSQHNQGMSTAGI